MSAKKFAHHFVPHHHVESDEPDFDGVSDEARHHPSTSSGLAESHRAHALNQGALLGYALVFFFTIGGFYFVRVTAPQILGTAQYTAEQIIDLTNVKRAEQGLLPFKQNSLLSSAAQAKSVDMQTNNYWAHYSPQGKSPWNFISAAGYKYIYAGENLARDFNDPQAVINAWMASPTHRSNVLDKNFKEIGVSVSNGSLTGTEGVLVVQMFGSAVSQVPSQSAGSQEAGEPSAQVPEGAEAQGESTGVESPSTTIVQNTPEASGPFTSEVGLSQSQGATVLASRQFSISKFVSLALVGFVFMLFVIEVAVATKKSHLSVKSSTLAHLGLLALVLFALWYAVQGSVI